MFFLFKLEKFKEKSPCELWSWRATCWQLLDGGRPNTSICTPVMPQEAARWLRGEPGITFPHRNGFAFRIAREKGCSSSELSLPKWLANWGVSHPSCPAFLKSHQLAALAWVKPFGGTGVLCSRVKMGGCHLCLNSCHPSRLLRRAELWVSLGRQGHHVLKQGQHHLPALQEKSLRPPWVCSDSCFPGMSFYQGFTEKRHLESHTEDWKLFGSLSCI